MSEFGVSRRSLICGLAAAGAAVPLVAACGGSGTQSESASAATSSAGGSSGSGSSAAADGAIKVSEIPVGGGKVFADQGVLITQPKAGEFRAFASRCTHQGTTLNPPVGGVMTCPNHGSQFSAEDGHNERGPFNGAAGTTPDLPKKTVTVSADGKTLTVA